MIESHPVKTLGIDEAARSTRGDLVFAEIRQAIIQLRLRPGNRLSEAEVARQLGVSRQPVREAFIKLSEAGLVTIKPQRGTLVRLISRLDVENAHFVREAIEVAAARKAALKADAAAIAGLRSIVATQAETAADDHIAFMRLDEAFHEAIARSAGTSHAWRILEGLKAQLDRVRFLAIDEVTPSKAIIAQHTAIVDALERKSPQQAEDAMRIHMSEILVSLPRLAEAHADLFSD
jgi:DNA-binding GntR family transcriptional regulator